MVVIIMAHTDLIMEDTEAAVAVMAGVITEGMTMATATMMTTLIHQEEVDEEAGTVIITLMVVMLLVIHIRQTAVTMEGGKEIIMHGTT